jgi:hypothetical protein
MGTGRYLELPAIGGSQAAAALPSSGVAVINELPGTNSSGGTSVIARTPFLHRLSPQL